MQLGGRNQSLGHYISKMNHETIAIFHSKFSESSFLPLFAFKALSRVVGSQPLNKGVDKVIFLDKQEAIRVFGYMPGFIGSRAAYFGTMASYILTHVGSAQEIKKIQGYNKQEFLKYRGEIEWTTDEVNEGDEEDDPEIN